MNSSMQGEFGADLALDYAEFYVSDLDEKAAQLGKRFGFRAFAASDPATSEYRSVALRHGDITLMLTEGLSRSHPASVYVASHGDGVARIALRTTDAVAAFAGAVANGARAVAEPTELRGTGCVTASIKAFGDVVHTFVQRSSDAYQVPPGLAPLAHTSPISTDLCELDHFAVCLDEGGLEPAVAYYEQALGFRTIFKEHVIIGAQAMKSKVVRSGSGKVSLALIEPDTSHQPGQIDEFLREHGGPGVQHIAFSTRDIVRSVAAFRAAGTEFLSTPDAYYELLGRRLTLTKHTVNELRDLDILIDEDRDGQLFQVFTRSTHPRLTFFFEVIERVGATSFGSGNVKALYEAVELERSRT